MNWWRIRNLQRKLLWIASVWVWPPIFTEKTFVDGPKLKFAKVFSLESFPLYMCGSISKL